MNKKFWTFRYALINITYFAVFCTIHAYAGMYLADKGFSNTLLGFVLAAANVLSVIIQPIIAGIIDKGGWLTNRTAVMGSTLILIIGSLILMPNNLPKGVIFAAYMVIYMVQMVYQPIIIAMNFEYAKAGCDIKFGLARGLGSAGFAVTSAIMGGVIEKRGCNVLLIINVVILLISLAVTYTFKLSAAEENLSDKKNAGEDKIIAEGGMSAETKKSNAENTNAVNANAENANAENTASAGEKQKEAPKDIAHNNFFDFMKTYPRFAFLLVGIACLFFAHNGINDYMFRIVSDLGGTKTQFGFATFLQAILELPMMAVIYIFIKKFGTRLLLCFSAVFFLIKIFVLYLAGNMPILYVSQFCQLFAYAIIIPVSAYYVEEIMSESDKVKGQAYINCAITISGVFSGLTAGSLVDGYGTKFMILVGCIVSLIGVIIIIIDSYGFTHKQMKRPQKC